VCSTAEPCGICRTRTGCAWCVPGRRTGTRTGPCRAVRLATPETLRRLPMADLRLPDLRSLLMAGRLGREPELRYTPNGTGVCTVSVAVTLYRGKDKEKDTLWLDVTAYGVA